MIRNRAWKRGKRIPTALACVLIFAGVAPARAAESLRTQNVILVTVDGLRREELFGGLDPVVMEDTKMSGVRDRKGLEEKYWRENPIERREALFPFFWGELAGTGIVLGNPAYDSVVEVRNEHMVSYPGYSEILTGAPIPEILGNAPKQSPVVTVLEALAGTLGSDRVAAFCSWARFDHIVATAPEAFLCNAGYEALDRKFLTKRSAHLNADQFEMLSPWDDVRFDAVTAGLALEYLKKHRPRVLYLALGETDDWAHDRRYDRVIQAAALFDRTMRDLCAALEAIPQYRGKTSIVVTTDHGRGLTPDDWTSHNEATPGSEHIWIGVFGPDTLDAGESTVAGRYTQGQVAATVGRFLGFDYAGVRPEAAPPLAEAFP